MKMITVGNGEKCPYCEIVITENINIVRHFFKYHEDQVLDYFFDSNEYDN